MALKKIVKITVDDLRTALYKEKILNTYLTSSEQARRMGFDSSTKLSNFLYRMHESNRCHVLIRVINYIIKMKGGIYVKE